MGERRKGIRSIGRLCPSLTTYVIRRVDRIRFEIQLDVAGEITKHKFESFLGRHSAGRHWRLCADRRAVAATKLRRSIDKPQLGGGSR